MLHRTLLKLFFALLVVALASSSSKANDPRSAELNDATVECPEILTSAHL